MKRVAWIALILGAHVSFAANYCVVVSQKTAKHKEWAKVVSAMKEKHSAEVIYYKMSVEESLPALRESFPRYACFVARPEETSKEFVKAIHRMTRRLDTDPYTDLFWGILTGRDAENALTVANTSDSLVIRNSLACTEIALDRCEQDLFVTSGHATERDLQLGFRYRNGVFRCKNGTLFGSDLSGKQHAVNSPNPKVYMPIGNCLMGHLDGPDSMAAAFLESAGVRQMMGYVEVTWYGYMGWGCLDYFIEQPGRYTFTEAFFANHHALIHRLETCFPKTNAQSNAKVTVNSRKPSAYARKLRLGSNDARGLLFDRDIVAFYGDPAWQAKMADGKRNWKQALTRKGDEYRFSITPTMGPASYSPVNENGVQRGYRPFIAFFDQSLTKVELISGQELNPVITDTFILVPNPPSPNPAKPLEIVFQAKETKRSS
jgi:hypothetical protein